MQQLRRQLDTEAGQLTVTISGDKEVVTRLLAALSGAFAAPAADEPVREPEPLYLTRDEAARRSGLSRERLSNLVKLGALTNYGSPAKLRFSLAEIRAWQEAQR